MSRDVELYYHPVKMAEADKLTPNFPWTKFFESQKVAAPEWFSLGIPAFHQEVSKMLGDVPVAVGVGDPIGLHADLAGQFPHHLAVCVLHATSSLGAIW